jgi:hypothetical protein
MTSGNHLRERIATLESELAHAKREIIALWRWRKGVEKTHQNTRAVLIAVAAISMPHLSEPLAKLLLGLLR